MLFSNLKKIYRKQNIVITDRAIVTNTIRNYRQGYSDNYNIVITDRAIVSTTTTTSYLYFIHSKHSNYNIKIHKLTKRFLILCCFYKIFMTSKDKRFKTTNCKIVISGCNLMFFISQGRPVEVKLGGKISISFGHLIVIC